METVPHVASPDRKKRGSWPPSQADSTAYAWLLTGLLIVVVVWTAVTQWPLLVSGWGKRDFLYFYTIGRLALERRADLMYDHRALHEFQVAVIPTWTDWFYSVYPPQTAILFASVAWLPYGWALTAWTVLTAAGYALVAWLASPKRPRALLIAGLLNVIPFWALLLAGQSTLWPLLAFGLGGYAYIQGHRLLAGFAFGLLFVKPQLGLVLAVVLLGRGEWTIVAGLALSAAAQFTLTTSVFGWSIWPAYAQLLQSLPSLQPKLESWATIQHGLTVLTRWLPASLQWPAWMALSLPVFYEAWRTWRGHYPAQIRMAVLVLASVLVCPHVLVYDCTLLVLPVLWAAQVLSREHLAGPVYLLILTFTIPFAFLFGVQLSIVAMLWFLHVLTRAGEESSDLAPPARQ